MSYLKAVLAAGLIAILLASGGCRLYESGEERPTDMGQTVQDWERDYDKVPD